MRSAFALILAADAGDSLCFATICVALAFALAAFNEPGQAWGNAWNRAVRMYLLAAYYAGPMLISPFG